MRGEFGEILLWLKTSGLRLLVIAIGSILLIRLLRAVPERIPNLMAAGGEPGITEREKRARTAASLIRTVGTTLVVIVAVMMAFREIGLDITPLIAGAGVAGLAIGFGAQSLIKTKEWSRAVLEIGVSYEEDVDRVIALLSEIGRSLAEDESFGKLVLEPPQVLGVEALTDSQVTIRMLTKTVPFKQWEVARELRRRIKTRFDREGIRTPYPHRVIITRPAMEH